MKGNTDRGSAKGAHNFPLISRNAHTDFFHSFHGNSFLEMTIKRYIRNRYSFGKKKKSKKKKNIYFKREMSWPGKICGQKRKKIRSSSFSRE